MQTIAVAMAQCPLVWVTPFGGHLGEPDCPGGLFNRLIWAAPDGPCRHYDNRHRFRMAGEHRVYAAGETHLTIDMKGWRIHPLIWGDPGERSNIDD